MKFLNLFLFISLIATIGCGTRHRVGSSNSKSIEEKYSGLLQVSKKNIVNKKLYSLIDDWYGTPYQYAGKTKRGVDCSGFTSILLKEIYEKEIRGSSLNIYNQCGLISKDKLQEGDLVFFKIDSKEISHIGVYLQNNKFVHASTKAGVVINDLEDKYYKKYFTGGGKIK